MADAEGMADADFDSMTDAELWAFMRVDEPQHSHNQGNPCFFDHETIWPDLHVRFAAEGGSHLQLSQDRVLAPVDNDETLQVGLAQVFDGQEQPFRPSRSEQHGTTIIPYNPNPKHAQRQRAARRYNALIDDKVRAYRFRMKIKGRSRRALTWYHFLESKDQVEA